MAELVIDPRFRGPPQSANGGYTCGMTARPISGPAEVTLHLPPPLDSPLSLSQSEEGVRLEHEGELVATARPTTLELEVPDPITLQGARAAAERYEWLEDHPYPTCFVCGPEREVGDGLRIFPGPVEGREIYAAPWRPDLSLADGAGTVRPEFVWAALDCPSGIVTDLFGELGLILLGRLAAEIRKPLSAGETHVVEAWPIERDGRKLDTGSAIFSEQGELLALARARWIELREG